MIRARAIGGARFVARLVAAAQSVAEARVESRLRRRRGDPRRWRMARLLWPLFAKGR